MAFYKVQEKKIADASATTKKYSSSTVCHRFKKFSGSYSTLLYRNLLGLLLQTLMGAFGYQIKPLGYKVQLNGMKLLFMRRFRCPQCAQAERQACSPSALFHITVSKSVLEWHQRLTEGQRRFPGCIPNFLSFRLAQLGNLLNTLNTLVGKRKVCNSSFSASISMNSLCKVSTYVPAPIPSCA